MADVASSTPRELKWADLYSEVELCKAALRLYTKPLFSWRKALQSSVDGKNLYDFARYGLQNLGDIHRKLAHQEFLFRPGRELRYNFNGKHRVIYLYPWEERLVDLMLFRIFSRGLQFWFSPDSYAYRFRGFGVDQCQRRVTRVLKTCDGTQYIVKRDISEYFPSIDHDTLLKQLAALVDPNDYLYRLLEQRVRFSFSDGAAERTARQGIPFGTAVACVFANVYLTGLDRAVAAVPGIHYFRYADDLLLISPSRAAARQGAAIVHEHLEALHLRSKPSHELNLLFSEEPHHDEFFHCATRFRHLGLEFRADRTTGLTRDKLRKIRNLFRYALRRSAGKFRRIQDPEKRARMAIQVMTKTIENGIRNVAILDYYLKHVEDEEQLVRLDRWLAETVLSQAFQNGHKRGNFRKISFARLRAMGLPSLVHRRRLIRHGRLPSPFFIWKGYQRAKSSGGTAARPRGVPPSAGHAAFSPFPEAAANKTS